MNFGQAIEAVKSRKENFPHWLEREKSVHRVGNLCQLQEPGRGGRQRRP